MTVDVVDTEGEVTLLPSGGATSGHLDRPPAPERSLRPLLIACDGTALFVCWFVTAAIASPRAADLPTAARAVAVAAVITIAGLVVAWSARLYRARVCAVRAVEVVLLARVAIASGIVGAVLAARLHPRLSPQATIVATATAFALLVVERGVFANWMRTSRANGRHARPVAILGTNDEALELCRLFDSEPELGYHVVGMIGTLTDALLASPVTWLGDVDRLTAALAANGATGCVMAVSAFTMAERRMLLRELLDAGLHVQLSSGIARVDHRRLRAMPLGREPAFYLERNDPAQWQLWLKQAIDLVAATMLLVFALPLLALAAIAIKLDSPGPVIYRQQRVGRGGRTFTIYKLRTMVTSADAQLGELMDHNERTDGPLFKLEHDPRVTRVGRLLRATSIDELPQLWCVLQRTMSLVGPRPPLPDEVEDFDQELRTRFDVMPGITGLWQVEARDNPSFNAYRRYDLFYVENWSIRLDLAILVSTFEAVVTRAVVGLRRPVSESTAPSAPGERAQLPPVENSRRACAARHVSGFGSSRATRGARSP